MKPRRDITLGEMQDECTKIGGICVGIKNITEDCKYLAVCPFQSAKRKMCALNLTDPPRFNEAQMALLRALYGLDFVSIKNLGSGAFKTTSKDGKTGMFMEQLGIGENETLDLAELLGKDGAE